MGSLGVLALLGAGVAFVICQEALLSAPLDQSNEDDSWRAQAIARLWEERQKMAHTPVFKYLYPGQPHVDILFKNESATKTGSLKHRYAWALMMWALLEKRVTKGTIVFEASSGNTAASEAYMCQIVGVNFTAIVPDTLEDIKEKHIREYGGDVRRVPISERLVKAQEFAENEGGFFMNQFANADKAEEFHESGDFPLESVNVFHEILAQLALDPTQIVKEPHYFVHSAGTGGTISSVGRYVKKYNKKTKVVMADTEFSVYADYVLNGRFANESGAALWITPGMAGTGYGPMGAVKHGETSSLDKAVIDRVIKVPDIASTAAMEVLRSQGISGGTSTGLAFLTAISLAARESASNPPGGPLTIALLLADPGVYYETSYYNRTWIQENFAPHGGLQAYNCWISVIHRSLSSGGDPLVDGTTQCAFSTFSSTSGAGSSAGSSTSSTSTSTSDQTASQDPIPLRFRKINPKY